MCNCIYLVYKQTKTEKICMKRTQNLNFYNKKKKFLNNSNNIFCFLIIPDMLA